MKKIIFFIVVLIGALFGANYYINKQINSSIFDALQSQKGIKLEQNQDMLSVNNVIKIDNDGLKGTINLKIQNYLLKTFAKGDFMIDSPQKISGNFVYKNDNLEINFNDLKINDFINHSTSLDIKGFRYLINLNAQGINSIKAFVNSINADKLLSVENSLSYTEFKEPIKFEDIKNLIDSYKKKEEEKTLNLVVKMLNDVKSSGWDVKKINAFGLNLINLSIDNNFTNGNESSFSRVSEIYKGKDKEFSNVVLKTNRISDDNISIKELGDMFLLTFLKDTKMNLSYKDKFNKNTNITFDIKFNPDLLKGIDPRLKFALIGIMIGGIEDFNLKIVSDDEFYKSFTGLASDNDLDELKTFMSSIMKKDGNKFVYEINKNNLKDL